jgi:hypothetical protein
MLLCTSQHDLVSHPLVESYHIQDTSLLPKIILLLYLNLHIHPDFWKDQDIFEVGGRMCVNCHHMLAEPLAMIEWLTKVPPDSGCLVYICIVDTHLLILIK